MKKLLIAAGLVAGVVVPGGALVPTASAQVRAALTQDIDQPGRNPFMLRVDVSTSSVGTFVVPAGQRYVINQYTGDCGVPNTTSLVDVELVTIVGGTLGFFHAPVHYVANIGFGLARYAGTGSGPFYADPGTTVSIVANTASGQLSDFRGCSFIITGHVINNP